MSLFDLALTVINFCKAPQNRRKRIIQELDKSNDV